MAGGGLMDVDLDFAVVDAYTEETTAPGLVASSALGEEGSDAGPEEAFGSGNRGQDDDRKSTTSSAKTPSLNSHPSSKAGS